MYDIVLFDLDGTLTDPGEGITNSVAYSLAHFGISTPAKKDLYKFIGPPLKDSYAKYYGMNDEQCEKAVEQYRVYFKDKGIFENVVYENTEYVLKELKKHGKKIILATSKPEEFAIRILKHFNLFEYFDAVGGASMDGTRSKKGDVIKYALEKGGITDTKNAVMVGDRKHDILGANENGIDSVGVTYGYGSFDELSDAGATYIFDKITDILNIIL